MTEMTGKRYCKDLHEKRKLLSSLYLHADGNRRRVGSVKEKSCLKKLSCSSLCKYKLVGWSWKVRSPSTISRPSNV